MDESNPWNTLDKPASEEKYSTRRIDEPKKHSFWWALDFQGQPGLAVEFKSGVSLPPSLPIFASINAKLSPDGMFLVLSLTQMDVLKKFRLLCHDLISEGQMVEEQDEEGLLENLVSSLQRWQKLFETRRQSSPTTEQKIGLIGELNCLRNFLAVNTGFRKAVDAWQGPKGHEQDFSVNGQLIEVKTQLSSSDKIVKINSLEQLDTISGPIMLMHLGLSPATPKTAGAISINSLIEGIINGLSGDNFGVDIFVTLLEQLGFSVDNDYGDDYFVVPFEDFFDVRDGFPSLTRSGVAMAAITKATYSLSIPELAPWSLERQVAEARIFND